MKNRILTLALAAALGLAPAGAFASPKSEAFKEACSRVTVLFEKPENFADVKDSRMATDKDRDNILDQIRTYVVETSAGMIQPGLKLELTFTEVDLAGDYEPWRVPPADDVRIVKDIYPPRFDFTWKLVDASGAVVKEGKEQLRDMAFMMRMVINRSDPLHYEKDMLADWLRSNLRAPKK